MVVSLELAAGLISEPHDVKSFSRFLIDPDATLHQSR